MNGFECVGTGASPVQVVRSSAVARPRPGTAAFAAAIVSSLACIASAQTAPAWRYDLRPGDHLVYRYTFQHQTQSQEERRQTESRFQTHVLVVGGNAEQISLGFQRNREAAEVTEYLSNGKDKLAKEQVDFQKRMQKRPSRFSEAMEISPTGTPRYSWEVARESYSHILEVLHEVMNLPPNAVAKGEAWQDSTASGLDLRWVNDESIHGKLCHHVEGAVRNGSLKLSYWWSPESGVLEQVALDGNYSLYDGTVHETARMELQSRVRNERIESWLDSADTRRGALQALLLTPGVPISAEQLSPVLASGEPTSQALALAIASRRKIEVSSALLGKLRQSASDQVRLLADSVSSSDSASSLAGDCRQILPLKRAPAKFGTMVEGAPATQASKEIREIPYLLRVPLSYREDRPAPLLVYLSGGGGFAIDGVNSADDVVSETDYLVLYPQAAAHWWAPGVARSFEAVFNDVLRRYNVDRDRIYVTGFSNGGTGALYFAELWPQRFAAVVSLMGAGQCIEQVKAGLPNLKNLPLLFVHGENDTTIQPECSKSTQAALTDLHPAIKPQLKILPNYGHEITLQSDDGLALAFFRDKIRNPFPRTVDLSEFDALATRAYWVEILDGKPGKSDLDARIKSDNTIEIHSHDVKRIRLHLRPELLPKPGDIRIVWNGKKMFNGPLRNYCSLLPVSIGDPKLDLADARDLMLP